MDYFNVSNSTLPGRIITKSQEANMEDNLGRSLCKHPGLQEWKMEAPNASPLREGLNILIDGRDIWQKITARALCKFRFVAPSHFISTHGSFKV